MSQVKVCKNGPVYRYDKYGRFLPCELKQYKTITEAYQSWKENPKMWKLSFSNYDLSPMTAKCLKIFGHYLPKECDPSKYDEKDIVWIDQSPISDEIRVVLTDEEFRAKFCPDWDHEKSDEIASYLLLASFFLDLLM